MAVDIKICGLSTRESVDAAIRGGATHIGMIFFPKSPRNVSLKEARMLSGHIGDMASKVAVTVNADHETLDAIVEEARPDILQLHGSETPEDVNAARSRYNLPVIKALSVRDHEDLDKAESYKGAARRVLLDAKPPKGAKLPGGNGVTFDWRLLARQGNDGFDLDQGFELPYMLSGGLSVANITEALDVTGAKAVDISSGVESAPGVKDLELIKAFLSTIAEYSAAIEAGTQH